MEIWKIITAAVAVLLPVWIARRVIGRRFGWSGRVTSGLLLTAGGIYAAGLITPFRMGGPAVLAFAAGFCLTDLGVDKRQLAADLIATLAVFGAVLAASLADLVAFGVCLLAAGVAIAAGSQRQRSSAERPSAPSTSTEID